jgi:hypothetical protein
VCLVAPSTDEQGLRSCIGWPIDISEASCYQPDVGVAGFEPAWVPKTPIGLVGRRVCRFRHTPVVTASGMVARSKAIHPLAVFSSPQHYAILRYTLLDGLRVMLEVVLAAAPPRDFVPVLKSFQNRVDVSVIADLRF